MIDLYMWNHTCNLHAPKLIEQEEGTQLMRSMQRLKSRMPLSVVPRFTSRLADNMSCRHYADFNRLCSHTVSTKGLPLVTVTVECV